MATKRQREMNQGRATKSATPNDAPRLLRVNLEVGDLNSGVSFYTKLLGVEGRKRGRFTMLLRLLTSDLASARARSSALSR